MSLPRQGCRLSGDCLTICRAAALDGATAVMVFVWFAMCSWVCGGIDRAVLQLLCERWYAVLAVAKYGVFYAGRWRLIGATHLEGRFSSTIEVYVSLLLSQQLWRLHSGLVGGRLVSVEWCLGLVPLVSIFARFPISYLDNSS